MDTGERIDVKRCIQKAYLSPETKQCQKTSNSNKRNLLNPPSKTFFELHQDGRSLLIILVISNFDSPALSTGSRHGLVRASIDGDDRGHGGQMVQSS